MGHDNRSLSPSTFDADGEGPAGAWRSTASGWPRRREQCAAAAFAAATATSPTRALQLVVRLRAPADGGGERGGDPVGARRAVVDRSTARAGARRTGRGRTRSPTGAMRTRWRTSRGPTRRRTAGPTRRAGGCRRRPSGSAAARGGGEAAQKRWRCPWGGALTPGGAHRANVAGQVPAQHGEGRWAYTAPVRSMEPRERLGFHHLIGNVWEWVSDYWTTSHTKPLRGACCCRTCAARRARRRRASARRRAARTCATSRTASGTASPRARKLSETRARPTSASDAPRAARACRAVVKYRFECVTLKSGMQTKKLREVLRYLVLGGSHSAAAPTLAAGDLATAPGSLRCRRPR